MAGKGDNWRKGTDFSRYWNSSFWEKPTTTIPLSSMNLIDKPTKDVTLP